MWIQGVNMFQKNIKAEKKMMGVGVTFFPCRGDTWVAMMIFDYYPPIF